MKAAKKKIWFIEDTVCVIILGLLFLLLYASSRGIIDFGGNKSRAHQTAYGLRTAISAYYTDYRHYPLEVGIMDSDLDFESGEELMTVLMSLDSESSDPGSCPRSITFFSGRLATQNWDGEFTNGVQMLNEGKSAKLWDPWGNIYRVRLDTNNDKRVADPFNPSLQIPETILVWSAGKDGDFSTWKDNVIIW